MSISGVVAVMMIGGVLTAWVVVGVILAMLDRRHDASRRHWRPAESATQ